MIIGAVTDGQIRYQECATMDTFGWASWGTPLWKKNVTSSHLRYAYAIRICMQVYTKMYKYADEWGLCPVVRLIKRGHSPWARNLIDTLQRCMLCLVSTCTVFADLIILFHRRLSTTLPSPCHQLKTRRVFPVGSRADDFGMKTKLRFAEIYTNLCAQPGSLIHSLFWLARKS